MKKIYTITLLCLMTMSCSQKDNSDIEEFNIEETIEEESVIENIYCFKTEYSQTNNNYQREIIKISKSEGSELSVSDLGAGSNKSSDLIYIKSSSEVVAVTEANTLIIANTETGNYSTIQLDTNENISYRNLTIDENENIFCFKTEYSQTNNNYQREIIKISKSEGSELSVSDLGAGSNKSSDLIYIKSSSEVVAVTEANTLIIVNTETGNYSTIQLDTNENISYRNLTIDENENVFCFKTEYSNNIYQRKIIKIDKTDGSEMNIADLGTGTPKSKDLIYITSTKEALLLTDDNFLIKVNTETGNYSTIQLDTNENISYRNLTIQ